MSSGAAPILHVRDVQFRWPGQGGFALRVPSFDVGVGETVLLLGDSGSGKSTLLSLLCGIIGPATGQIHIAGREITGLGAARRDRIRAEQIGVIFQQFNLLPFATVRDNILLPLRFAPARRARVPDPGAEGARLCRALRLPDNVAGHRAGSLSVGQQQRVAVARALIGQPPLIIADEPTSALDEGSQHAFLDLLFGQVAAVGAALVMVSHDARLGVRFDRVTPLPEIAHTAERAA